MDYGLQSMLLWSFFLYLLAEEVGVFEIRPDSHNLLFGYQRTILIA